MALSFTKAQFLKQGRETAVDPFECSDQGLWKSNAHVNWMVPVLHRKASCWQVLQSLLCHLRNIMFTYRKSDRRCMRFYYAVSNWISGAGDASCKQGKHSKTEFFSVDLRLQALSSIKNVTAFLPNGQQLYLSRLYWIPKFPWSLLSVWQRQGRGLLFHD